VKGHLVAQTSTISTPVTPGQYVYVFDEDFAQGTAYTLQITSDLSDTAGNTMTTPTLVSFTPAIPYLQVTSIALTGTSPNSYLASNGDLNKANFFPICSPSGPPGSLQVVVNLVFSQPFSTADRAQFAILSFCQAFFPTTGPSALTTPTLTTVAFNSATTLTLTYQGFSVNTASGAPYYYQIKVPGGSTGVKTTAGNTLKEDVWLNFATGS